MCIKEDILQHLESAVVLYLFKGKRKKAQETKVSAEFPDATGELLQDFFPLGFLMLPA